MSALQELIEAVEANATIDAALAKVFDPGDLAAWKINCEAHKAYNGSLDAALRLHNALLPGYTRLVDATAPEMGIRVEIWEPKGPVCGVGDTEIEARSWLLAILRALQAQEAKP